MIKTREAFQVYHTNADAVTVLAQAGDYIREHSADLLGTVIGDGLSTGRVEVSIILESNSLVKIRTVKDNNMKVTIPFEGEEDTD